MKGQFNSIFEFNMELELIEVDRNGVRFGMFRHFFRAQNLIEITGDFIRAASYSENVTVRTVTNHIICLKWRQSQNETLKKQTVTSH
jgi:hypothetical protein